MVQAVPQQGNRLLLIATIVIICAMLIFLVFAYQSCMENSQKLESRSTGIMPIP
jgi:hypothetical protein